MPSPGWIAASCVSTPSLKANVLSEPGFTGSSPGALLPRVTRITCWLSGVARIWWAYLPVSSRLGWSTLGARVDQPNRLDTGKYAHQIRATPDNQQVILVTRGNNAPGDDPVNPGSLKTFAFKDGVLTQLAAIQPGDGMHFGPRHLDFHPTQPWVYVSIESQNKLYVYRRDAATGLTREPIFIKETLSDPKSPARQGAGTVHVHPNGRTLYLANRASTTVEFEGKKVFAGGENSIAAFSIDQSTGEPTLIRNVDGRGITLRTFGLDPTGRMLVAASQIALPVRDGATVKMLSAGLSVYRIGADGELDFVRKYDVDVGGKNQFWSGVVALA